MTQPAPSYQQYQPMPPRMGVAGPPKPSGGGLTSLLAGILALVAAGLAVGGSFAPISVLRITNEGGGQITEYRERDGWWSFGDDGSTDPLVSESKLVGLVLVLSAVLLVVGAVFAFTASRTRTSGPTTGGRTLIAAGVGVLTGVVLAQAFEVLRVATLHNDRELAAGESIDFGPRLGLVLPLCAVVVGLVAVVLAHIGQKARAVRQEPNTPRMGFPAPYGYQAQGAPTPPGAPGAHGVPGTPPPGVPATGSPGAAPAAPAESAASSDDDSEITQVVSNATASGENAPAPTPPTATAAPAAPEATKAPTGTETSAAPQPPAAPQAPTAPAAPAAPAASAAPTAPEASPAPETPPTPATPEPSASPEALSTPAPPAAQEAPEAPSTPAPESAAPGQPEGAAPLPTLPAAPPPPELSSDTKSDDK